LLQLATANALQITVGKQSPIPINWTEGEAIRISGANRSPKRKKKLKTQMTGELNGIGIADENKNKNP
jgi:hypothetical protein